MTFIQILSVNDGVNEPPIVKSVSEVKQKEKFIGFRICKRHFIGDIFLVEPGR
jgi:hypothetical protein